MRIVQYHSSQGMRVGALLGERIVDLKTLAAQAGAPRDWFHSPVDLLRAGDAGLELAANLVEARGADNCLDENFVLGPPVVPGKIIAIGLNYRDHASETGAAMPAAPLCFAKFPSSLSGPYDPILLPAADADVDFEGELGVVIGRVAKRVKETDALNHVAGYLVCNDVSARKWQFADGQWTRGKSCDTFAPIGPSMVTRDEVTDPQNLKITTRVNGVVVQDSTTAQMIFAVAKLVSYLSYSFTLNPGDIIATGTPAGVGVFRKPPQFLHDGDVVEVEIERLGRIRNPVCMHDGDSA